jgi:hypothetical protein
VIEVKPLGCVLFPLPLVLVPAAAGPVLLVLAFLFAARFGSGLGVMVLDISIGSIFAALILHHLRARVSGAFTVVNYGVRPLGSLAGGFLGRDWASADALDRDRWSDRWVPMVTPISYPAAENARRNSR